MKMDCGGLPPPFHEATGQGVNTGAQSKSKGVSSAIEPDSLPALNFTEG